MSDSGDSYNSYDDYYEFDEEDYESVGHNEDVGLTLSGHISRIKSYDIFDEKELMESSMNTVKETKECLELTSKAITIVLLKHFKWNKEKAIEKYIEIGKSKIFKELGFSCGKSKKPRQSEYDCSICFCTYPAEETYSLGCKDRFCNTCWSYFLEEQIKNGLECVQATCPNSKCRFIVKEKTYKKFLSKESYKIYKSWLTQSFIVDDPHAKFCPSPDCNYVIKLKTTSRVESVECKCGFEFCFSCADFTIGNHLPASCQNVKDWLKRETSESENIKWMAVNTKKCPNCHRPIEKNGGCMHMTCHRKAGGCGHEFCWLCRQPWKDHTDFYKCNKYREEAEEQSRIKEIKSDLDAYMFYYHRYNSHRRAMLVADELKKNCQQRSTDLINRFNIRYQDTVFLFEAADQLLKNRRALQWSYVYGFYVRNGKEKNLLEYLQEDLERYTEVLSSHYERKTNTQEFDYHQFTEWKNVVLNCCNVNNKFLQKFIDGVVHGLT